MSTTFGVLKEEYRNLKEIDESNDDLFIEIAFRGNSNGIYFTNELAKLLPDELPVYPLDNSAQGIYTIGDIKESIN